MKLFNVENGKEKVYVQMNDITFLSTDIDIPIPASIFMKVFTGVTIVNNSNRFEFVEFEEPEEVEFFRKLDWIIDYKHYIGFLDEELEAEVEKTIKASNEIVEKYNAMSEKERFKNQNMVQEHTCNNYKLLFLQEIYDLKHKKREMPFPKFIKI
jgi:hypothetical protein